MMAFTVDQINRMTGDAFVQAFGEVAEKSPWVAEAVARQRPFASVDEVKTAFDRVLDRAPEMDVLELIRAHPDLAGKAAMAGEITDASKAEQSGAGLNALTRREYEEFVTYNDAYRSRFGFPFIYAVKGADKHMILDAFRTRLRHEVEVEFREAVVQIKRIIGFRLAEMVQP